MLAMLTVGIALPLSAQQGTVNPAEDYTELPDPKPGDTPERRSFTRMRMSNKPGWRYRT